MITIYYILYFAGIMHLLVKIYGKLYAHVIKLYRWKDRNSEKISIRSGISLLINNINILYSVHEFYKLSYVRIAYYEFNVLY